MILLLRVIFNDDTKHINLFNDNPVSYLSDLIMD